MNFVKYLLNTVVNTKSLLLNILLVLLQNGYQSYYLMVVKFINSKESLEGYHELR